MKKHGKVGKAYINKNTGQIVYRIKGRMDDEESVCYIDRLPKDLNATYSAMMQRDMEGLTIRPPASCIYYIRPKYLRKIKRGEENVGV